MHKWSFLTWNTQQDNKSHLKTSKQQQALNCSQPIRCCSFYRVLCYPCSHLCFPNIILRNCFSEVPSDGMCIAQQSLVPGSLQLHAWDYVNTDIPIFFNIISGTVQVPSHQSQKKSNYSSGYSNTVPSLQTFIILICITSLASNFSFQNLCVCIRGRGGLTCWRLRVHVSWHFLDATSGFLADTSKGSFFTSLLLKG